MEEKEVKLLNLKMPIKIESKLIQKNPSLVSPHKTNTLIST